MPLERLALFDTTLRDGVGGPFRPSTEQRRELARCIAEAGLGVIELFAVGDANPDEARALAAELPGVTACVIARATAGELDEALHVLEPATYRRVHLYADLTRREGVPEALEGIWAARTNLDSVEFSPLRALQIEASELLEHVLAAVDSGATIVNLSDTAGQATPEGVAEVFSALRDRLDGDVALSFHGHDDAGRAVANALSACRNGAQQVHLCIDGVGPRGGNPHGQNFVREAALDPALAAALPELHRAALERAHALVSGQRRT
jgi:2-isopropylmalate synthase